MTADHPESREPTIFNSLLMLFIVGIFLFVALLYRQNDLSLLMLIILMVIGGAKVWGVRSTDKIRISSTIDGRRVFPGESIALTMAVENCKWLPISTSIMWSVEGGLKPAGDNKPSIWQTASVLWHQTVAFRQVFVAVRRGLYPVGPPRIRTSDFFGFFEKKIAIPEATHIIVYPKLIPLRLIAIRRRDFYEVPGAKSPVQDPIYILGTRDYQASRPSRHIHWKASARHLRLQEKVFEPSEQEKVLISIDVESFTGRDREEYFENTLEVAASLAVKLDRSGYAVGLATNGTLKGGGSGIIPVKRGFQQISAILETLARLMNIHAGTIYKAIEKTLGPQKGVSCVHFCLGDDSPVSEREVFFQKRRIPATYILNRHSPALDPPRLELGTHWYSIDNIRLDRTIPS